MTFVNKTKSAIQCERCDSEIEVGEYFHEDNSDIVCECCYEDAHEYDNEDWE